MELTTVRDIATELRTQVHRVVVGQDDAIDLLLVALLCEGHVLFEGVPGVAKTLLARAFASGLSLAFGRIQFTPDLMPGDILGTNLFNFQTNTFTLTKGPIFTQLLLADEINRTPPKTQAALLQAMQERAVTIDGAEHALGDGFLVIATQNPIEQEGTYLLPEAQLDRFLFKVVIGYPSRDEEVKILDRMAGAAPEPRPTQVLTPADILQARDLCRGPRHLAPHQHPIPQPGQQARGFEPLGHARAALRQGDEAVGHLQRRERAVAHAAEDAVALRVGPLEGELLELHREAAEAGAHQVAGRRGVVDGLGAELGHAHHAVEPLGAQPEALGVARHRPVLAVVRLGERHPEKSLIGKRLDGVGDQAQGLLRHERQGRPLHRV